MNHLLLAFAGALALAALLAPARATPVYAVRAGQACNTCHIEPSGWANPPDAERRCTLSCKACHVSPTGGGLRTPSGRYYGTEVLPTWGLRPGEHGDPAKYRPAGHPEEGRYRLWEGFSGWWPGPTPARSIDERYGNIDADPWLIVGGDLRGMVYAPLLDDKRPVQIFPMQADAGAALRLGPVTFAGTLGLRGRRDGGLEGTKLGGGVLRKDPLDYLTIRELYAMVDDLPWGSYVRAGRFSPVYGWRVPDHTSFIRRGLGFDHDRQVFGVGFGMHANYLFFDAQAFRQGIDVWPGDDLDPGVGASTSVGWRALGWQLAANAQVLQRQTGREEMLTGMSWALNLCPFVYLGQLDFRLDTADRLLLEWRQGMASFHELDWLVFQGVNTKLKYDWMDPDLELRDDHFHRLTAALAWHPFMYTELELSGRYNWRAYDFVDTANFEVLLMGHLWF
jgi:hypothetical protein